jgi:transglutaminase-like putative cysteine protease
MRSSSAEQGWAAHLVLLLSAITTLAVELACEFEGRWWLAGIKAAGFVAAAVGGGWILRRMPRAPRVATVTLVVWAGLPCVVNLLAGWLDTAMWPLELVLLAALRNLGLGLAAMRSRSGCARLAGLVSLFTVLAAIVLSEHPLLPMLLGVYVAVGAAWLMLTHWSSAASSGGGSVRRVPIAGVSAVLLAAVAVAGAQGFGSGWTVRTLGEWLPSSGGTGEANANARDGVGDGLDSAGGENADSIGFTEREIYREAPDPSLYDVMTEIYGQPVPPERIEKAISISPRQVNFREQAKVSKSLRPGREFPMMRQTQPRGRRQLSNHDADALFYIEGPTPLHLRTHVYESFDGLSWHETTLLEDASGITRESASAWMRLKDSCLKPVVGETVKHRLKIGTLEGRRIPTPAHLRRFEISRVNRADFYSWSIQQVLSFTRSIPASTVINTESGMMDRSRLLELADFAPSRRKLYVSAEVTRLTHQWVADVPAGWAEIETLVQRIREACAYDPAVLPPEGCNDPVAHFLLISRRGPDYQFAAATAAMLAARGYSARLVSGLYVSPDRFDARSGHTPVQREDLHFWPEVRLTDGTWVVLEPTPGYEVDYAVAPRSSWLAACAGTLWAGLRGHWRAACAFGLASMVLWASRRPLHEVLGHAWWLLAGLTATASARPFQTLRLIEKRSRLAGRKRPDGLTPAAWYQPLQTIHPEAGRHLDQLLTVATWLAHMPPDRPRPWTDAQIHTLCRRVVHDWGIRRLRHTAAYQEPCT